MNYKSFSEEKVAIKVAIGSEKVAIEVAIDNSDVTDKTKEKIKKVSEVIGSFRVFGRKDVAQILSISQTAAGNLINKMKNIDLIESVKGKGKGKYKFKG